MLNNMSLSRRQALGAIIGTTGALIGSAALGRAIEAACLPTPSQTEGPFIHYTVHQRKYYPLTTQMYFAGDTYLEKDRIFRDIPTDERKRVVVELEPPGTEFAPDSHLCRFDLILRSG